MLFLYAYWVGLLSLREIERACWDDAAFRVLTGIQQQDHSRISYFRCSHLGALAGLFVQVLKVCQKAGLVSMGHVVLDASKILVNSSMEKAMNHEPVFKSEQQLEGEMRDLLLKAKLIDAQEDGQYGKKKRADGTDLQGQGRLEAATTAIKPYQRNEQGEAAERDASDAAASGLVRVRSAVPLVLASAPLTL